MALMSFKWTVLKNLFSKPATRNYPYEKREFPEGTRGSVKIDMDTCIFCGICAKKCPADMITVKRDEKSWSIESYGCISCAACVDACPKKSLSMNKEYTSPDYQKKVNTYTKGE